MNCAVNDLSPYIPDADNPWNKARAVHLYRRAGFGADIDTLLSALDSDPLAVTDALIQGALDLPLTPQPEFAFKVKSEYGLAVLESILERDGYARNWIIELQNAGLRGRMTLFWHNHFVTRFDVYESSNYMWQYHKLLQEHALGNFKDFVRQIGLTPAMLVFLNGTTNFAGNPNENYAREVYELFTLGEGNGYTQTDIEETARAFTGYTNVTEEWGEIAFDPATHDAGTKTVFGQTGNWDYDDIIDLLFAERADETATFIAGKLYQHFVNPVPCPEMIAELAAVFQANDWDIAELMRAIFQSAHFFDENNFATVIYGHLEHLLIFYNEVQAEINGLSVLGIYADITQYGQALFNPVDVAGWTGNRAWINTVNLIYRRNFQESQTGLFALFGFGLFAEFVIKVTDETTDVDLVCRDIIQHFIPRGFQFEADYAAALVSFKGEIPQNYFEDGTWSVTYWATPFQLRDLLNFLVRMPEYQLK